MYDDDNNTSTCVTWSSMVWDSKASEELAVRSVTERGCCRRAKRGPHLQPLRWARARYFECARSLNFSLLLKRISKFFQISTAPLSRGGCFFRFFQKIGALFATRDFIWDLLNCACGTTRSTNKRIYLNFLVNNFYPQSVRHGFYWSLVNIWRTVFYRCKSDTRDNTLENIISFFFGLNTLSSLKFQVTIGSVRINCFLFLNFVP